MKQSKLKIMLSLVGMVKPLAGWMVLAITLGVLGFLSAIFITVFGAYAMFDILGLDTPFALSFIFPAVLIFALCRGILRYGEQACNHFIAFKLLAHIRDLVFGKLRELAPAKLEGRDKGDLISVITSDIELLEVFYAHTISPMAIAFCVSLIMCLVIGRYHPLLGLFSLLCYVVIGVVLPVVISRQDKRESLQFRNQAGEMSAFVLDSLRGLSEIQQYHQEDQRLQEMLSRSGQLATTQAKTKKIQGKNSALCTAAIHLCSLGMLAFSGWLYQSGRIGFDGMLVSFVALISSFGPVIALANLGSGLQPTLAAGARVLDILHEEPLIKENKTGLTPEMTGIYAKDLSFAYEDETVLDHISLTVPAGKIIGIAGRSGSGKSTLLKLMMRFWEVEEGRLTIGDTDIKDVKTQYLRDLESYVTQETVLFHDTIENNIKIGRLDATHEAVIEACKEASIHDFIMSLPQGYETNIGELGDLLSGGEKQRIGLARAFLHDSPVILLDEPTSNLDSLNEAVILKSLYQKRKDKTIILVSHRQSTMRIADEVIKIESGRIS